MITKAILLKLALELPVWLEYSQRETTEARTARMDTTITAMMRASDKVTWARGKDQMLLGLLVEGHYESRFALFVHNMDCLKRKDFCDHGRAISPWQLQRTKDMTKEAWLSMGGTSLEATTLAAEQAARTLSHGYATCKTLEGAFALYATGSSCKWSGARLRYKTLIRLESRARKLAEET